jgi:hypothetical protein
MAATMALRYVGIEHHTTRRDIVGHEGVASMPVRTVADPPALLARFARDDT